MPTYSHSRLNQFENCPRAYKFKYVEKVEVEEAKNVYGFLGTQVHKALETFHEDLKNGRRNSLDGLLEIFRDLWEEEWTEDVDVPGRYSPEHFRRVGRECITNYYESHEPFDRNRTVDTELRLYPRVSAGEHDYKFMGYVDRLDLTPGGRYEIHDYKTSKNLPTRNELETDRQLALYQLGVQQSYPDADDVELVWHYVRYGKDIRISHFDEDLGRIRRDLVGAVRRIERAVEEDYFPTKRGEGATCKWCDYRDLCPEWRHLHETRELPENEFPKEDGVKLVDELDGVQTRLDELDEKKSELEERKKRLKETILEYAGREGVNAVFGSEKKASIEVEERIKFPKSRDPRRDELDRLIRESGFWDDLSVNYLNLHSLRKAFKEEDLPEDLMEELEGFKEMEERRDVELKDVEG